jgi:hypothetical protein
MRYTKKDVLAQLEKCLYDIDIIDKRELKDNQIEEIRPFIKSIINNSGVNFLTHFYTAHGLIINFSITRGENNEICDSVKIYPDDIKALIDSGLLRWIDGTAEGTSIGIKQF